ncbi:BRO-N domain-containing protein [Ochrobactrum soli]|uniref:BRO domain-containing protein n=1 Tax=Ochrobactrum soli TaxID=2448455 RepID=A0A849KHE6_9HYPH|nr:Bro-N domain-containing protein [[Ochrobactrum] soli]NNU59087.1 BRO domain-containing protein [[Ochrobactrum] soli]
MNNALTTFNFNSNEIRVVTIDDQPWFVAKDVCKVLELANPSYVTTRLEASQKASFKLPFQRGSASTVITKGGLFSLILSSRKPEAKAFKLWVTDTVLPAIEKDGAYIMGEEKVASGEMELVTLRNKPVRAL